MGPEQVQLTIGRNGPRLTSEMSSRECVLQIVIVATDAGA